MKFILVLSSILVLLSQSSGVFASTYTQTPTVKPVKTTVIEQETEVTLSSDALANGKGLLYWEVFNREGFEQRSTEKSPKFKFDKDGLKDIVLTVKDDADVQSKVQYKMVTTLIKPEIISAKQKLNKLVVNGTNALPNSVVTLFLFSEPKIVTVKADSNGYFNAVVSAEEIGYGQHTITAMSASEEAVAEVGFIEEATKVVQAQINNQLTPGEVIQQSGDRPLIVAQPIASDPVVATLAPLSSWMVYLIIAVFLLIVLILISVITKHLKSTVHKYSN